MILSPNQRPVGGKTSKFYSDNTPYLVLLIATLFGVDIVTEKTQRKPFAVSVYC